MKRSNAEVAKHGGRDSFFRLGILSLLTLMMVLFTSGVSTAAEDFTLFQFSDVNQKWETLDHIDDAHSASSVKWLVSEPSADNYKQFVKSFSAEPFKFAEGLKAAALKAAEGGDKAYDDFKKAVTKGLSEVDKADYGNKFRKEALEELVEKVLALSKDDLKKLDKNELLKKIFDKDLRKALDLRLKNPDEKKPGVDKPSTGIDQKTLDQEIAKIREEMKKIVEAKPKDGAPATDKPAEKPIDKPADKPDTTKDAVVNPAVQTPVVAQQVQAPRVGELDDAALRKMIQPVCDQFNTLQKGLFDSVATSTKAANDALNAIFDQIAGLSRVGNVQTQKQNDPGQFLAGVIADAFKNDNKKNDVIPPQAPLAQASRAQRVNDTNNTPDIPLPPPQQQDDQQQPPMMPFYMPQMNSNAPQRAISLNLPSTNGRLELRDAEDIATQNDMRTPLAQTLSLQSGLPDLVMAKAKIGGQIQRTQAALTNAKQKAAALDDQLEQLKEGGRAALPDWVKRQEAQLKQDLEQKKNNFNQAKQYMMQMMQMNPQMAQQMQMQMMMQQQQVNQAEQAYNQFESEIDLKVSDGDKQIKSLAKQRDRLQSAANKLEQQLGGMKEDQQAVQQLVQTNMQMQMAAMQPQQKQSNGVPNVNKIMGFGGSSQGGPRGNSPLRLNSGTASLPSGSSSSGSNGGQLMRGSLGSGF